MSDLTTRSVSHTARSETLQDSAKSDAKAQALKGRNATLDTGMLSRLTGLQANLSTQARQGLGDRAVRINAETPGPQRIAQTQHDGKSDVQVFGKGGIAAKGAEPVYANANAHEAEPQYANAKFAKGEVESGYSVLRQETEGHATGRTRSDSEVSMLEANPLYRSADGTGSRSSSRSSSMSPYLTARASLGGTFQPLSQRLASIGDAPAPRLERLKAAVQKLFAAVKSLATRVAQVRSRSANEPPRASRIIGSEVARNPALARRALPPTPYQTPRTGAVSSGYESGEVRQRVPSQSTVFENLSMTERYEERLRTDMKSLSAADKSTVRRLAGEIDRAVRTAETLDIELTDAQELQIAQHRHDIALVLENHARRGGGGEET